MSSLNQIILVGNLGNDPEIRTLEGGTKVGKFSIATNERYRDKDGQWKNTETQWHNIVVWRGLAERAEREFKKGQTIYVEGKMTYRKWTDKDGIERYTSEIIANAIRAFDFSKPFALMAELQESATKMYRTFATIERLKDYTPRTSSPSPKPAATSTPTPAKEEDNTPPANEDFSDKEGDDLPF